MSVYVYVCVCVRACVSVFACSVWEEEWKEGRKVPNLAVMARVSCCSSGGASACGASVFLTASYVLTAKYTAKDNSAISIRANMTQDNAKAPSLLPCISWSVKRRKQ